MLYTCLWSLSSLLQSIPASYIQSKLDTTSSLSPALLFTVITNITNMCLCSILWLTVNINCNFIMKLQIHLPLPCCLSVFFFTFYLVGKVYWNLTPRNMRQWSTVSTVDLFSLLWDNSVKWQVGRHGVVGSKWLYVYCLGDILRERIARADWKELLVSVIVRLYMSLLGQVLKENR